VNYRVRALINGAPHIVTGHKPLPHTGQPFAVKTAEAGGAL
jgi:hypothetical protein